MLGLHDDEAESGLRPDRRHQQVDVLEYTAAGLVQHQVTQALIAGNPAGLLPQARARRRIDAADDNVADFALGMTGHHVNDLVAFHGRRKCAKK